MTELSVVDIQGKSVGKRKVNDGIFGINPNRVVVAQAVRIYLANQRQGTAKSKTRGEVSGSGKKIWRQKGTGRARHGDRYAPIFVGGGVAHGPRGNQNLSRSMPKGMKRSALYSVLSQKVKDNQCIVIKGLESLKPKTKNMYLLIKQITGEKKDSKKSVALVVTREEEMVKRAARNLRNVELISAEQLNAYELLNSEKIVITEDAIKNIENRFANETESVKNDKEKIIEKNKKKRTARSKIKTAAKPKKNSRK